MSKKRALDEAAWRNEAATKQAYKRVPRQRNQEMRKEFVAEPTSRQQSVQASAAARQIIVLGMHRSGTSALTGALARMGVYVGDEDELTPGSWENPAGFFERRDARKICDALLHQSGADWWKVSAFQADNANRETVHSQGSAIRDLIRRLDQRGAWALKEPRLCLLLPIFQSALRNPLVVISIRHPVEVARSLRRRNGFPIQAGLALWEAYIVSALRVSRGIDHVFVDFHQLTHDPASALNEFADELAKRGIAGLDVSAAAASIQPALRRERFDEDTDGNLVTSAQRALWTNLTGNRSWKTSPKVSATAMSVLQEFESDEAARQKQRTSMKSLSTQLQALEQDLATKTQERTAQATESERKFNVLFKEAEELKHALEVRNASGEVLHTELELTRTTLAAQSQAHAEDRREIGVLRDRVNTAGQQLEELRHQLLTRDSQVAEQQNALGELQGRYAQQEARLAGEARGAAGLRDELASQKSVTSELRVALAAQESVSSELRSALERTTTDRERLEVMLSTTSADLAGLQGRFAEQAGHLVAESGLVEQLHSALSNRDSTISELRGAFSASKAENMRLSEELSSKLSTLADLQTTYARERERLERATAELKIEGEKRRALSAKVQRLHDKLLRQQARMSRQRKRAENQQGQIAELSASNEALARQLQALESSAGWRIASAVTRAHRRLAFWSGVKNTPVSQPAEAVQMPPSPSAMLSAPLVITAKPVPAPLPPTVPETVPTPEAVVRPKAVADSELARILPARTRQSVFGRKLTEIVGPKPAPMLLERLAWSETDLECATTTLATRPALPLVTIIMPTFNRATVIGDAIRSVSEQAYPNWELMVCDDASTDDTEAVVARFENSRIHYLKLQKCGAAAARNAGLRQARGAFIAYLDSDNYWHPCHLARMVLGLLESPGHSAIFGNYVDFKIKEDGSASIRAFERPAFNHENLLDKNFIDLNTFVHRRELYDSFGGFNEALTRRQDYDLIIKYTWLRDPLQVNNLLTLYRRDASLNQITTVHRNDDSCISLINESITTYLKRGLPRIGQRPVKRVTVLSWDLCRNHFSKPFALCEALSEEYEVQLVAFRFFDEPIFPPLSGVRPSFRTDYFTGADFPDFFATMRKALDVIQGDVIYVVKPRLPSLGLALLANAERGIPVVLEINDLETVVSSPKTGDRHEDASFDQTDLSDPTLRSPYSDTWSRIMDPIAKALPVLLTHNKNIDAHFGNRCLYMRNLKDEKTYDIDAYDRHAMRASLGFAPDDRVILFGGMLRKHKGIYELVELMERLNDPRYKLLFVGSRETPDQKKLVQRYGDTVKVLPPQDREAMARINHAADLVILWLDPDVPASHYQMPYKATDAFAMGPTIIANDISDLGVLANQGYLYAVPYGDWDAMMRAVRGVFEDSGRTAVMRDAGHRLYLRQFSYPAARSNFELAARRAIDEVRGPLAVAQAFASRFSEFYRHSTGSHDEFLSDARTSRPLPASIQRLDGADSSEEDRSIAVLDLEQLTDFPIDDPVAVAVVIPSRNTRRAFETARLLVRRAGMSARFLIVADARDDGFVSILNAVAGRIKATYIAFLPEHVFPGKNWLRTAYESLEKSGKGLFAFNCGKWKGSIAEYGMLRVQWARTVYGAPIFSPHYRSHLAARELTLVARASGEFAYDPEAVVASLDFEASSASAGERDAGGDPADHDRFRERFRHGFDGQLKQQALLAYADEFLGQAHTHTAYECSYDECIRVVDVRTVDAISWREPGGIAVIMPSIDTARGLNAARLLARRAGVAARFYVVGDTVRQGFIKTLNQLAARLHVKYVVYLAEDAVPGVDWLRIAHEALETSGKGLLAFNCGKWRGRIAAFGMVRTEWIRRLYGGDILHSAYRSHRADNEVTAIARATDQFIYCPEALLVENDPKKVFRLSEGSAANFTPHDKRLFVARFNSCFDGLATTEALAAIRDEYLNQHKLSSQQAAI